MIRIILKMLIIKKASLQVLLNGNEFIYFIFILFYFLCKHIYLLGSSQIHIACIVQWKRVVNGNNHILVLCIGVVIYYYYILGFSLVWLDHRRCLYVTQLPGSVITLKTEN